MLIVIRLKFNCFNNKNNLVINNKIPRRSSTGDTYTCQLSFPSVRTVKCLPKSGQSSEQNGHSQSHLLDSIFRKSNLIYKRMKLKFEFKKCSASIEKNGLIESVRFFENRIVFL